jgi:hypothetical protein
MAKKYRNKPLQQNPFESLDSAANKQIKRKRNAAKNAGVSISNYRRLIIKYAYILINKIKFIEC